MKIGMVIELENGKEYAVADIVKEDETEYLYLVNITNQKDICFGTLDDENLNLIEDENIIEKLIYKVTKQNFSND